MDETVSVAAVTQAIAEFEIYARHGVINGQIRVGDLHQIYKRIRPVLHPLASNDRSIDLDALAYGLARLPHNICTVRRIRLKRAVPKDFDQWKGIKQINTDVQGGRATYDIGNGEIVMLIQEDAIDVLDVLSLLCCLTVECLKVRNRLNGTELQEMLKQYAPEKGENSAFGFQFKAKLPEARKNQLFAKLAFELGTDLETILRLDREWKGQLIQKMYEISAGEHDIVVQFHTSISKSSYASRIFDWARDVGRVIEENGLAGRPIHVISTDAHCVLDCLLAKPRCDAVKAALKMTRSETLSRVEQEMVDREGSVLAEPGYSYYMHRMLPAMAKVDAEGDHKGIYHVDDKHQMGISCRIIDVAELNLRQVDPRLKIDLERVKSERPIILDFDRVYGSQGAKILSALTGVFPKQIRSYSVVFLGGALDGGTGTIMIPNYTIKDGTLDVIDFLVPNSFDPKFLKGIWSGHIASGGPVVTVLGIVLQSHEQLVSYNQRWKAIGVETVAAPHGNALNQAMLDGNLSPDMRFNLLYVASDNPIREQETLAHNYRYIGIEPHYAITVAILNSILGS